MKKTQGAPEQQSLVPHVYRTSRMRAKRDVQVRLPKLCRGAVKGAGHREQSHALDPPIAAQAESPVNTDSEMEVEEEQGTPEYTFMTLRSGRAKIASCSRSRPCSR